MSLPSKNASNALENVKSTLFFVLLLTVLCMCMLFGYLDRLNTISTINVHHIFKRSRYEYLFYQNMGVDLNKD